MNQDNMVIIGSGHAGARAAQTLRSEGWDGRITMIGAEARTPYERPPLSKAVLQRRAAPEDAPLFPSGSPESQGVDHLSGVSVRSVNREARQVILSDGRALDYHRLLLATGAGPRQLTIPGMDLRGGYYLRSAEDAAAIADHLQPGAAIVIIGGGLIGLEVAASAAAHDCKVTVVEAGPRLMMRAVPAAMSGAIHDAHREKGTRFIFGRQVARLSGEEGKLRSVELDDGAVLPCDAVVVAIGVNPRTELAADAGLAIENGIAVDQYLRSSDPDIFAAGDVCSFALPSGERIRLECWKNAEDQGVLAGRNMLGAEAAYDPFPWMWSDQFGRTMQIGGRPELAAGEVERLCTDGTLLVYHLDEGGRIAGISGFGSLREVSRGVRAGRLLMEKGVTPDAKILADPEADLRLIASGAVA